MPKSRGRGQVARDNAGPLQELLAGLTHQGLSQREVAERAGLPQQYLSDILHNRRPLRELTARRLGEEFGCDFRWLLGEQTSAERPHFLGTTPFVRVLPVLSVPVTGEPTQSPAWDGSNLPIVGVAVARLEGAERPYVLRFGRDDVQKRLFPGDLVAISQAQNDRAEISVVEYRAKLFLARRRRSGVWKRVAEGKELPSDSEVRGHVLGIVWSDLC